MREVLRAGVGVRRLKRWLPSAEAVRRNRWLGWMGPRLSHPKLWGFNRRAVARGMAIGVFFAFIIPLAQAPAAGVTAILLRSNLPVALVSTMVSNPLTYAPIYYAAYRVGDALVPSSLGATLQTPTGAQLGDGIATAHLGKSLVLGLSLFAVVGALLAYFATHWIWRWQVSRRWKLRRLRTIP